MNTEQKHLVRTALMLIFLILVYLFLRLFIPSASFFVISIVLLGLMFFMEYSNTVILNPLVREIAVLKHIGKMLRKEKALLKK